MTQSRLMLSVVVPIFNEEAILEELYERLSRVLVGLKLSYEVIFVDDGSADRSASWLERIAGTDPAIRLVQLSRNFGLSIAVTAGLDHASGQLVALMDGDLQDAPEDLPRLIAKAQEGYDVVYAVRVKRKESWIKRTTVFLFYRLLNRIASTPLPVDSGLFSVMSRSVVDALKRMPERSRYVSGLRAWIGFKQCGIPFERSARRSGAPQQTMRKLSRMALDGMLSFSHVPLRIATYAGLFAAALSGIGIAWAMWMRLFSHQPPAGWTSMVLIILFLGSVQLLALGIIGEYLGRVYDEVKGRPLYVVRQRLGFQRAEQEEPDGDQLSYAHRLS